MSDARHQFNEELRRRRTGAKDGTVTPTSLGPHVEPGKAGLSGLQIYADGAVSGASPATSVEHILLPSRAIDGCALQAGVADPAHLDAIRMAEQDAMKEALNRLTKPGDVVMMDIYVKGKGGELVADKKHEGIFETHAVVLQRNDKGILVIDPSNPDFSRHMAGPLKQAASSELEVETVSGKRPLYKTTGKEGGRRDCVSVGASVAMHIKEHQFEKDGKTLVAKSKMVNEIYEKFSNGIKFPGDLSAEEQEARQSTNSTIRQMASEVTDLLRERDVLLAGIDKERNGLSSFGKTALDQALPADQAAQLGHETEALRQQMGDLLDRKSQAVTEECRVKVEAVFEQYAQPKSPKAAVADPDRSHSPTAEPASAMAEEQRGASVPGVPQMHEHDPGADTGDRADSSRVAGQEAKTKPAASGDLGRSGARSQGDSDPSHKPGSQQPPGKGGRSSLV